ncbi:SLATT domain-containing protein [Acinetobacter baumannii]|uniref:SLATT domain-containing protein n=1 Tax=Acinetobacter baumannii TaxID=470 RepID=UPI0020CB7359|nr:SLATT domain-containing protein [Acinetobacter baumannii]MCQ1077192.1 SLATT domain-containing protein [Acinetobacter baumannii]MCT2601924.1 SLATT domain-containing protein [Acinetobacter baumannii]MDC4731023.1 SLATT domain-containing protein [Acinetobacter baumannii]MDI9706316.1 SLATT domain-containing protein [Acinetobacter baumannii]MDN8357335.1 SLATT domain-containing protein [Acinetobacter baumannii]
MNRADLLKCIADTGYNVGFGAKKHFATYDLVEKSPGWISFLSIAFGIYSLAFKELSTNFLSASFTVLGVVGLYISMYDAKKSEYEMAGVELTKIYNQLRTLYYSVQSKSDSDDLLLLIGEYRQLENQYCSVGLSKQILFSDWYAHYKFFWQHQIDWVHQQKKFKFFRDKVPLSFYIFLVALILMTVCLIYKAKLSACFAVLF